jgi:uncharacterized protein (TIGR03435 family)
MPNRLAAGLVTILAALAGPTSAQAPAAFDVASVKPNRANDRLVTISVGPGGLFSAKGYTLVLLIQRAYGVMDWNVTGGPGWIRDDRFDIVAKANTKGDLRESELQPMLAKLLEDRFRLKLRRTTTTASAYALVIAPGGPTLRPSPDGEEHRDSFRLTNTGMIGQGISMRNFARFFGGKLGLIVADETGLTGLYDFSVNWTIDDSRLRIAEDRPLEAIPAPDPKEPLREAAFAAASKQLGLNVVPKRVAIETLVVEHAERASASDN